MGVVVCIAIAGLRLWFNSLDHLPPHFHVTRRDEWEIRVFFLQCTDTRLACELKWPKSGKGPNAATRDLLRRAVMAHQAELLAEWQSKVVQMENEP